MKNSWRGFVKWLQLSTQDQLLLIQAFVIVMIIQVGLRWLSFQQFRYIYGKLIATKKKAGLPNQSIEREIWAIQTIRKPLTAFCLPQALALTYLLKADKGVKLVVGIQKTHKFEAHAWVEKDGIILLGELPDFSFKPIWIWH